MILAQLGGIIACPPSSSKLGWTFQSIPTLFSSTECRPPLLPARTLNLPHSSSHLCPTRTVRIAAASLDPLLTCEDSLFLHILDNKPMPNVETISSDNEMHDRNSVVPSEMQDGGSREVNVSHAGRWDGFHRLTEHSAGRRHGLLVGRQVFLTGRKDYKRWMPRITPGSTEECGQELSEALLQDEGSQESSEELGQEEEVRHVATVDGEKLLLCSSSSESGRSASLQVDGDVEDAGLRNHQWVQPPGNEPGVRAQKFKECNEDFLTQFLKKRSRNWDASWKGRLRQVEQRYALEKENAGHLRDAPVALKDGTHIPEKIACDPHRDSTRVMYKSQDLHSHDHLSEALVLSTDGGNVDYSGRLIQKILCIAKALPQNVCLEDFLGEFHGKITTHDGNQVLESLANKSLTWPLLSFFQWMRVQDPCPIDSRAFCNVFTHLGKVDMVDQAIVLFRNIPEGGGFHCVQVYNSLLTALARCNRGQQIPWILRHMEDRDVKLDSVSYSILITATKAGELGRLEMVWSMFDCMLREGLRPSVAVYGSLIKAFCDEGQLQKAMSLSLSMEKMGLIPNEIIFNTLIDAHSKARLLGEAEGLLLEMKEMGMHPTEFTYNSLINGYGKNGQCEVAEELLLEMQNEGLRPDVFTYTSLISAYAKQKMTDKAVNVFLRMRKTGIAPTTHSYTALINAYSEGGWHVRGQRAFDNMIREGLRPTVETYTALLDGYRQVGDLEMIKHVWRTIKDDSNCKLSKVTYRTAVDAFAKHGLYNEARDVIEEFRKRGLQPDTMIFNMLLNAAARGGLYIRLPKLLLEMRAAGYEPDPFTYCTIIYAALRHRDFTSAFKYEKEMTERGQLPDPQTYKKMKHILNAKYALKLENNRKAEAGSKNPQNLQTWKRKNPQRKKRRYNLSKQRAGQVTEHNKAPWKLPARKNLPY